MRSWPAHVPIVLSATKRQIGAAASVRAINIVRFVKPVEPASMPRPKTVVLQGDMMTVAIIRHPFPNWRDAARDLKKRSLSKVVIAKQRLTNLLVVAPKKAVAKYKERRDWRKHVMDCRSVTLSEPKVGTDYKYVIDKAGLRDMITQLADLRTDEAYISSDMEAKGLGHESPLCVMQVRDHLHNQSYLIDLLVLGRDAFKIKSEHKKATLKTILEAPNRKKLIFDGRQDPCTLFANAGVKLQGIIDLQIMYMLTSDHCPPKRTGLKNVVELTCELSPVELSRWNPNKADSPGQQKIWENRPLAAEHRAYALGDVELLGHMYKNISARLNDKGIQWAQDWSAIEVQRIWCKAEHWKSLGGCTSAGFDICWGGYAGPDYPQVMRVGPTFWRRRKIELELEDEYEDERNRRERFDCYNEPLVNYASPPQGTR